MINQESNSDYHVTCKNVDLSLWNSSIQVSDIVVCPKKENEDKKIGIYASVATIEITDFSISSILFGSKIKAEKLRIRKPDIVLYKNNNVVLSNPKSIQSKVIKPFDKIIVVSTIFLTNGNVKVINQGNNAILASFHNLNIHLEGIVISEASLQQKIPLLYKNYSISCDSLFYRPNVFYTLKANELKTTKTSFQLQNLQLKPVYDRKTFVQKIPKEKDLFTVAVEELKMNTIDWGFNAEDVFYFTCDTLALHRLDANIYRGKMPKDDLSKKKLYTKLLRELPFDLQIKNILLKQSKIVYEEEKTFEEGPGKLIFDHFKMHVTSLSSAWHKTETEDTKIAIHCNFMKETPLKVDWKFNVLDSMEGFEIKGKIIHFNAEKLAYFTKPYLNVVVKGNLDKVFFNFKGNDIENKGDFALEYNDLNVVLYRNDKPYKKNKFLSALGNLLVKNDSDKELKTVTVEVKRNQEKSFYNFLWISVADGLKQILL
ncbi:hypothetical protein [Flavobacterium sp. J27]|uniref:hypothetical protein n=1 Tax=Flavobacterium sp. J27 TaxID=2060419 RepID=UPI00103251A7|nr:hypothetical protein [Flavobacterium sp. J27]